MKALLLLLGCCYGKDLFIRWDSHHHIVNLNELFNFKLRNAYKHSHKYKTYHITVQ